MNKLINIRDCKQFRHQVVAKITRSNSDSFTCFAKLLDALKANRSKAELRKIFKRKLQRTNCEIYWLKVIHRCKNDFQLPVSNSLASKQERLHQAILVLNIRVSDDLPEGISAMLEISHPIPLSRLLLRKYKEFSACQSKTKITTKISKWVNLNSINPML